MYTFLDLPLCRNYGFYHRLQISWLTCNSRLSTNEIAEFLSSLLQSRALSSCCKPPQYDQTIYLRVALGQFIITSLAKQFIALHIFAIMKLTKIGTDVYFTNSSNHWPERHCDRNQRVHRNRVGTIGRCDVTIPSGRLMGKQLFTPWNYR